MWQAVFAVFSVCSCEVREKTVGEGVKGKTQREQGSSKMNMEL